MASNTSYCCPVMAWPMAPDDDGYQEKGQTLSLSDELIAYYVAPSAEPSTNNTKGIIFLPDVYGARTTRVKTICDFFANHGFSVIAPDCFRGERKDTQKGSLVNWLRKYPFIIVKDDLEKSCSYLKNQGIASIGAVGFCWGAWALTKASAEGNQDLKCGVGIHPSIKIESWVFEGDEESLARSIQMPILLLPAGNDLDNVKPGGSIVSILEEKGGDCKEFPEMIHGWVTRGDYSREEIKRDGYQALNDALEFFNKFI